jgi:hypothetical protein
MGKYVAATRPRRIRVDDGRGWPLGADVGSDTGSPASPDYGPTGNRFTGEIEWVQLDIGEDSHDHLITPEERFNLAMARQ